MSVLEWNREPRRILLPILILAPFPVTDLSGIAANALIDTGSSVSGITSAIAASLGLTGLGKRPLKSAQGEGQVERFAFRVGLHESKRSEELPAFPFVFDEVIGIDLRAAFEFQALIGMDILSLCDLHLSRTGKVPIGIWHLNRLEPAGSRRIQWPHATSLAKQIQESDNEFSQWLGARAGIGGDHRGG